MSRQVTQSGRALLFVMLAIAVVAVAWLLVGGGLLGGGEAGRGAGTGEEHDLASAGPGEAAPLDAGAATLAGRYGEGDLGALRLRLLDVNGPRPLEGRTIRLFSRQGQAVEGRTGADGVVEIGRLTPERSYRLEIRVEGFAPLTIQGVRIAEGRTTDLGDILLGQNVVLRGRVIDVDGRPVPDAAVAVYTPGRGALLDGFMFAMVDQVTTFPEPAEKVLTDTEGWFNLVGLLDGTYRMEVRGSGFATRYEADVVVAHERPARSLTIVLGEGAVVRGRVTDEEGQAVANARIVALKDLGGPGGGGRFRPDRTLERDIALTDGDGRYELDTLTKGSSYMFGVLAEGYAPVFEMTPVEVGGEPVTKDFALVAGGSIAGVVVDQATGGPVANATVVVAVGNMMGFGGRGFRRPGASGDEGPQNTSADRVTTDDEGHFLFRNVVPGPVLSAQVKASGYVPFAGSQFTGNGWPDVVAHEVTEVRVELVRGGVVEGTVRSPEGRPIAGADVTVVPRDQMWRVFMTGSPNTVTDGEGRYVIAGVAAGRHGVVAAASGYAPTNPMADDMGFELPEAGGTVAKDIVLAPAGVVTGVVTDGRGEPVAGARVRTRPAPSEAPSGGPGARGGRRGPPGGMDRMRSFLPGGTVLDVTDQEGRFVLQGVDAEQRWVLEAEAEDYVPAESEPFNVRAGEEKKVDIVLSGGGDLAGRVVDDRGQFVANARVRVGYIPDGEIVGRTLSAWQADRFLDPRVFVTDEDGRFLATSLRPGRALVKVEHEDFVTFYRRNAEIRADERTEGYMVALSRGEVMEGRVLDAQGKPISGAMVAVTSDPNPGGASDDGSSASESDVVEPRMAARSDDDGHFRVEKVPAGRYSVVVWFAPGYQGWVGQQSEKAIRRDVPAGDTGLEFRLDAAEGGAFPGFDGGRPRGPGRPPGGPGGAGGGR